MFKEKIYYNNSNKANYTNHFLNYFLLKVNERIEFLPISKYCWLSVYFRED